MVSIYVNSMTPSPYSADMYCRSGKGLFLYKDESSLAIYNIIYLWRRRRCSLINGLSAKLLRKLRTLGTVPIYGDTNRIIDDSMEKYGSLFVFISK